MRITKIEMEGVFSHEDTIVELPDSGLVLVTGRNGSGKTSLIEAIALCLWGTTFRKKNPGWSGNKGRVVVQANDHKIERVKMKSKVRTTFDDKTSYTRVKDAAEHAVNLFGSFDIWRRVHVFASRDVSRFTTSTDAFRKRMLEELLGLDRFEEASAACRKEKKLIDLAHQRSVTVLAQAQTKLQTAEARLKDAEETVDEDEPEDAKALVLKLESLNKKLKKIDVDLREINRERREADQAVWSSEQDVQHAEEHARSLEGGTCSECGQKITAVMRKAAAVELITSTADATDAKKTAQQHRDDTEAQHEKLSLLKTKLTEKHQGMHRRMGDARRALERKEHHEGRRKKIAENVIDFMELVDQHTLGEADARKDLDTIQVVDRVLSTQGVRAHLLTNALSAIEAVANSWLGRVAAIDETELVLKLSSYAERGDGSLRDAIGLEIEGAGNGYGYEAASTGEQRRIDVSLMLALAEMAEAAHGVESGTLFFDEVFDALDEEGVEAVRDVIASLAEDRCVLLITHNDQMKARLKGLLVEHWHVEEGEIR